MENYEACVTDRQGNCIRWSHVHAAPPAAAPDDADLRAEIAERRQDAEFMGRIRERAEQDKPILDRLASGSEGDLGLPEHEWLIADLRARVSTSEAARDAALAGERAARAEVERLQGLFRAANREVGVEMRRADRAEAAFRRMCEKAARAEVALARVEAAFRVAPRATIEGQIYVQAADLRAALSPTPPTRRTISHVEEPDHPVYVDSRPDTWRATAARQIKDDNDSTDRGDYQRLLHTPPQGQDSCPGSVYDEWADGPVHDDGSTCRHLPPTPPDTAEQEPAPDGEGERWASDAENAAFQRGYELGKGATPPAALPDTHPANYRSQTPDES